MQASDRLLTLAEAAAILRAPVDTMRHWRKVGKGPEGFKVGRRVVYRESDVLRFIDEQRAS
jgi:predicted DNA-binding transcriptional regulator AlpA